MEFITQTQHNNNAHRIDLAEKRIQEINDKIRNAQKRQEDVPIQSVTSNRADWTNIYSYCENLEDIEELMQSKSNEVRQKEELLKTSQSMLGHNHDHSGEREIFHLPESEKKKLCERYRILGNYLFEEGIYEKAAENYRIALSYYEYCFPENPEEQKQLDELRRICLCNISLCYFRLGEYREAIHSASLVIQESRGQHAKAFFRRAKAYQALDEYE